MGIDAQIEEYTRLLANPDISKRDEYEFTQILNKLTEQKKIADEAKRKAEREAAAAEKARKEEEARIQAEKKR